MNIYTYVPGSLNFCKILLLTFKCLNGFVPPYLHDLDITKCVQTQCNVPVKSKLKHPPPRAFEFLKKFCSNSPLTGPKSCSNAPPPGKLPDYCFNFSVASIMLLRRCMLYDGYKSFLRWLFAIFLIKATDT